MKNKIRLLAVSICCLFCCAILSGCGGQFQEADSLGAGTALPEEQQLGLESPSEKADVTFYGQLPPVPEGLPVLTIQEMLKGAGFGADLEAIALDKRHVGYYSLDLSALSPIGQTKEGAVLCRLTEDSEPLFLFALDRTEPTSVQLFKKPGWILTDSEHEILLDGAIPNEEAITLCHSLAEAFDDYLWKERSSTEGQEHIQDITYVPKGLTGLQFHISFCKTRYEDGSIVYSTPTEGDYAELWDWIPPVTFFGQTSAVDPEVPVKALCDILAEAGIDPSTMPQDLQESFSGYYSLDLSKLFPLYVTELGEYVCRLEADREPSFLFVLDTWQAPSSIRFYSIKDWSWPEEEQTLLLDGMTLGEKENEICQKLVHAYRDGSEAEKATIFELDGSFEPHLITISFGRMPGLQFHIPFVERFDPAGYDIYSTVRQEKIFIPR